jgi:hypothetical protein
MKGYDAIDTQGLVRFQFPGLVNPPTAGGTWTIDVLVYRKYRQLTYLILTGTKTVTALSPWDIFDNPNNSNGLLGVSTNISPVFTPDTINSASYTDLKFTPYRAITPKGGGMFIFFPALPTTTPTKYLLPPQKNVSCTYLSKPLTCFSYPEANMMVVENLPVIASGNEVIIRINGFVNAPYVVDLHKSILMWTFSLSKYVAAPPNYLMELEQFKYLDLDPLAYGEVLDAYVLPYQYQALQPAVTYDWVFRLSNDVPEGGKLVLSFPANYYDLQSSSPCPTVELVQGVEWLDPVNNPNVAALTSCGTIFATSIATISSIKPVKKLQVIVIRFKGVQNPSQEGWTPYFQIETRNAQDYIIDRIQTVPQVYITRKFDVQTIVFDGFWVSPSNGNSAGNNLRGDYHLSFYPQTAIPANGLIKVTFPAAEFTPATSWPTTKLCIVGGSLKTYKSCSWETGTQAVINIYLDTRLDIEPGMEPVRLTFPHIRNFNSELSSGVVVVATYYDGLVLDESGSDVTNRKAVTSKEALALSVTGFDYYPRNAGNVARYVFTMAPVVNVDSTAVIVVEFPYEFPKDLGSNIVCTSAALQISSLDPIVCRASEWRVNITNHKGWTCGPSSCSIAVEIYGVVNPNTLPAITDQINVYIYNTTDSLSEYKLGLGALAFTAAPPPLLESWAVSTVDLPRKTTSMAHQLTAAVTSTSITQVNIHFCEDYDSPVLSSALTIKSQPAFSHMSPTYRNNSVYVSQNYQLTANVGSRFEIDQLSQPYSTGMHSLYTIELEDTAAKSVVAKTYANLINRNPPNLQSTEIVIKVNDEKYFYLAAGTYSDAIPVVAAVAPASDIVISA